MNYFNLKPIYYFGQKAIEGLQTELKNYNFKKALILYGGGSIKKNGAYNDVVNQLKTLNIDYLEFSGIEPNPRDTTVSKAIDFVIDNKIDLIIAVGGGSVIDASKVIATMSTNRNDFKDVWDYVVNPKETKNKPIPIISVITLAGTASENNAGSVITNQKENLKMGVFSPHAIPFITIGDPTYTYTVNKWQTASGVFDCFSHLLEQYFGQNTFDWTKEYIFANLRILLQHAKNAVDNPNDYNSRANILWTTSMALNGIADFNSDSDWNVHFIEHSFSAKWDITHGAGLALVTPIYLQVRSNKEEWFKNKVIELGEKVFNVVGFDNTINYLKEFINQIGLPSKWNQFDEIKEFNDNDVDWLVNHTINHMGDVNKKEIYYQVIKSIKDNI